MENKGIEISLNSQNIVKSTNGFGWNTTITYTSNRNKITDQKIDEVISGNSIRQVGKDFNTLLFMDMLVLILKLVWRHSIQTKQEQRLQLI
jgi:hypothetical protein